jgi:hypothetical protein
MPVRAFKMAGSLKSEAKNFSTESTRNYHLKTLMHIAIE